MRMIPSSELDRARASADAMERLVNQLLDAGMPVWRVIGQLAALVQQLEELDKKRKRQRDLYR